MEENKMLRYYIHRPFAIVRLFCFPPAGGSTSLYEHWSHELPENVEVVSISLPGRGSRIREKNLESMDDIVHLLSQEFISILDKPFILFGHSAGAIVAYAMYLELCRRGLPLPLRLIVSASPTPNERNEKDISVLLDCPEQAVKMLREWGGTEEGILDNPELLQNILPAIKADLKATSMFKYPIPADPSMLISTPISVFGGIEDKGISMEQLSNWKQLTRHEDSKVILLPGSHFYFSDTSKTTMLHHLSQLINNDIQDIHSSSKLLIESLNCMTMEYPSTKCLHELFQETALAYPDRTAVLYEGKSLTFGELDRLSDKLADYLYQQGIRPNQITGIYMEHCIEFVIAYIAALKAGGGYMPLELVYPPELLHRVLKESAPKVILTKDEYSNRLPSYQTFFCMNDDTWVHHLGSLNSPATLESRIKPTPDDLAYVVMSSGTTGIPKGICCPHRGAVHSYYWRLINYPYDQEEREACHVFFVWELLRPLIGGIPLYIIPDTTIYDPIQLIDYLSTYSITRVLFTPSLLQLILDTIPDAQIVQLMASLRTVWLCGEVVTIELRNRFVQLLPNCKLLNLYSISECHDVSAVDLRKVNTHLSPKFAPCGTVMENVRAYVLDENLRQLPFGVPGELYIGGPCLAIGYLNRPEQTAERFIPDPFTSAVNARLYRTGDRGRFLENGHLELIGRCDFMVKVRGYSVVLGAVEAALAEHPRVSSAVVITEGSEGDDKRLVAYIVPEEWDNIPSSFSVREFLKNKLPHYAIPSVFVQLDALPINAASGKLDRKKLPPVSEAEALRCTSFDNDISTKLPLQTPTQIAVASIWADLLRIPASDIGLSDSFFDIGGHSLLATRLVSSIRDVFNVKFTLSHILTYPELEKVAEMIGALREQENPSTNSEVTSKLNVSQFVDLSLEAVLDPSIYPAATRKIGYSRYRIEMVTRHPRLVFLTGATGFLGAHILHSLMLSTDCIVYCLVRGEDKKEGMDRIEKNLRRYKLWKVVDDKHGVDRIVPVLGDLSKPLLGLDNTYFKMLAGEIDCIIHSGAEVNLVKPYSVLKPPNVLGTQEILRLAVTNGIDTTRVKPVHFISTNGVFSPNTAICEESSTMENWRELKDGYAQSKWVAEQLCIEARQRGLPVSILRPGNMAPSSHTGIWNNSDFIYLLLEGCSRLNQVPSDVQWKFDLTPVDFASEVIVYLSCISPRSSLGQTFHIQNPQIPLSCNIVFDWMMNSTTAMKKTTFQEWKKTLEVEVSNEMDSYGLLHQLEAGLDSFDKYLTQLGKFDCRLLLETLEKTNIKCPNVDQSLWDIYMKQINGIKE